MPYANSLKKQVKTYFSSNIKNFRIPLPNGNDIEVAWEMDSSVHFDDQIEIFTINNKLMGFIIADGVSLSAGGRIASTYLCEYIPEYFQRFSDEVPNPTLESVIDFTLKSINYSTDLLKKNINYIECRSFFDNLTAQQELFSIIDCIEFSQNMNNLCNDMITQLISLQQGHSKFLSDIYNQLNELNKYAYSIKEFEKIIDLLQIYNTFLQKSITDLTNNQVALIKGVDRIRSFKEFHNFAKNPLKNYNSLFNAILSKNKKRIEAIEGKTNGFSKLEFEELTEINNEIIGQIRGFFNDMTTAALDLIPNLIQLVPDWLKVVINHLLSDTTNVKEAIKSILTRFNDLKMKPVESTLALILFLIPDVTHINHNNNPILPFISFSLGDPEIFLLGYDETWLPHFYVSGGALKSFISNKMGLSGRLDICTRFLNPNDILIVASDGANVRWTTPGGYDFTPFKKLIEQHITENKSIMMLPRDWLLKLKEKNSLSDDFSLIAVRLSTGREANE